MVLPATATQTPSKSILGKLVWHNSHYRGMLADFSGVIGLGGARPTSGYPDQSDSISSGRYAMVLAHQRSEFLVILDYAVRTARRGQNDVTDTVFLRAAEHLGY